MHSRQTSTSAIKVFVTSAYEDPEPLATFLNNVALDKYKKHRAVTSPEEADIILFIENSRYHFDPFFKKLRNNPLVKKYPEKVFMYNPHDLPWFILPGLYTCLPKIAFDNRKVCAICYIEIINPYINFNSDATPAYLFSFYGKPQSKPRKEIMKLQHNRGIIITSEQDMYAEQKPKDLQLHYAQLLTNSKFILCPKGIGTSSSRLFETMQAGRVPVIISDNWVRPAGPDWDEFAIFIPEDEVHTIPDILEKEEESWPEKSRLARKAWEDFFAPESLFTYFTDNIITLERVKKNIKKDSYFKVYEYIYFCKYFFRKTIIQPGKALFYYAKGIKFT
ncbi:MAG: exostosin family protein [Hymenobacter sp.]|nr:exostosin family protein [Hymenobacter sp.]